MDSPRHGAARLDALPEPVRLVVWDLDETFWRGTLSEGGIAHVPAHEAIVAELARRGIIGSICSKNDRDAVMAILAERGLADLFVLPSIDWTAKGPRLAALVEAVQLRPASILFIDDNHLMREEARHHVPGLNVADESVIPHLLDHPLLAGKADPDLTRLAQYRLLALRHAEQAASGDADAFLRDSGITVSIEHDVEAHLDRAIELINRTNQLNYTKRRLPEDIAEARAQLLALIGSYDVQAGLVRVRDRYGDYGFVGFYAEQRSVHPGSGLHHYCFSCRVLGMGVEAWLYRRLGRPAIPVAGEVLVDIFDDSRAIDWIAPDQGDGDDAASPIARAPELLLRGGCELLAVSHYCRPLAPDMAGEFAFNRDSIQIRLDHSMMLRHAIEPPSAETMTAFARLGFGPEDFRSRLTGLPGDAIAILSFWGEPVYPLYRHRPTGALIPFNAFPAAHMFQDLTTIARADLPPDYREHWIAYALADLAAAYDHVGTIDEALFKDNLALALAHAPQRTFVLGGNKWAPPNADGIKHPRHGHAAINRWTRDVLAAHPGATYIGPEDYLTGDHDVDPVHADHFARPVYHRLFRMIEDRL